MDFDYDIFQHPGTNAVPEAGTVLVASPRLRDPYFRESVVLLIHKDSKGGFLGLIMNRPTKLTLTDITGSDTFADNHVIFCGGPVEEDRLFTLHSFGALLGASLQLSDNLFVGAELEKINSLMSERRISEDSIRFFMGYCGWVSGQLEDEISEGYWGVMKPPHLKGVLDGSGNDYWRKAVQTLGEGYKSWLLMPNDPRDN